MASITGGKRLRLCSNRLSIASITLQVWARLGDRPQIQCYFVVADFSKMFINLALLLLEFSAYYSTLMQ